MYFENSSCLNFTFFSSVTDRPPARIMDSVCADTNNSTATTAPTLTNQNNNVSTEANGITNTMDPQNSAIESVEPSTSQEQQPQTYDDLFPSLPTAPRGGPNAAPKSNPIGEWNKKPMILSSTVTQVMLAVAHHLQNGALLL